MSTKSTKSTMSAIEFLRYTLHIKYHRPFNFRADTDLPTLIYHARESAKIHREKAQECACNKYQATRSLAQDHEQAAVYLERLMSSALREYLGDDTLTTPEEPSESENTPMPNSPTLPPVSYSRLNAYETCPARYKAITLDKLFKDEKGEKTLWGERVHNALASAIGSDDNEWRSRKDRINYAPLPAEMSQYQPIVDYAKLLREGGSTVIVEDSITLNSMFQPVALFAKNAWLRTRIDFMSVRDVEEGALRACVLDWKTGKKGSDLAQLYLYAFAVFAKYAKITHVTSSFVWMNDPSLFNMEARTPFGSDPMRGVFTCDGDRPALTTVTVERKDVGKVWGMLEDRFRAYEIAHTTGEFPPRQSGLCRAHCPVTTCGFNGNYQGEDFNR